MPVILKNNAFSTLATAITASDTGIVVADGSKFPALSAGEYFYATLVSPAGTTEIIKVTARVSNSLTVVRAQDGSSAASFQVGARLDMRVNAASITDLVDEHDQAAEISITDAGGYYTSGNVEGALQEVGGIFNPTGSSLIGYTQGGAGSVTRTVQSRLRDFVSVKDFGAVGDGITDDTAAIQAAIDYAISSRRGLLLSDGDYKVTDALSFINADGITVTGEGSGFNGPTRISAGTSMGSKALLYFDDCRNVLLQNFSTRCNSTNNIKCAIEFTNGAGTSTTPTHYFLENLYLYSTSASTGQTNGVLFSIGSGGDQNNDFGHFHKVVVSNYDNAAVRIDGSQAREIRFYGCYFQDGTYAVDTAGFSFFWFGGNVSQHTGADFYLRREQQSSVISGLSSEQSSRLLLTSGAIAADGYLTIQGVRFAADNLNADGRVIRYQHRGALVLQGNVFGTRTDPNLCKLSVSPPSTKGCAVISLGNTWGGAGSLQATPYEIALSKGDKIRIADNYVDASTLVDTDTVFTDGDISPSVFASDFWTTANTGATTIIQFDNAWVGKQTHIYFNDANTTIDFTNTSKLRGNNGATFTGAVGDSMICTFDGSVHHCTIIQG